MTKSSFAIDSMIRGIKILHKGDVEKATNVFSEVSRTFAKNLIFFAGGKSEHTVLVKVAYMMESAALYYMALACKRQDRGDIISQLAYLGYAAGIKAVLDALLLPIVRRQPLSDDLQRELAVFLRMNGEVGKEITEKMHLTINTISRSEKRKAIEMLEGTIRKILEMIQPDDSMVRELAVKLARRFPAGDFKQARRVYEFVRDEIHYVPDPLSMEEVQSCETTLKLLSGDCDDKAVLLASLLGAISFETCLFIADVNNDGFPDHIYVGAYLPNAPEYCKPFPHKRLPNGKNFHDWVPLDPTYEDSDFGVIPITDLQILKIVMASTGECFDL